MQRHCSMIMTPRVLTTTVFDTHDSVKNFDYPEIKLEIKLEIGEKPHTLWQHI